MDFLQKLFNKDKNYYTIKNKPDYHIDVTFNGSLPYSNSSIIIKTFSKKNKDIAVACRIHWFMMIDDEERKIENRNLNYLHLSAELIGMKIRAVIEPFEDIYKEKAEIDFFIVKLDNELKKAILTLKSEKNSIRFDKIEIYAENNRNFGANFSVFLNESYVKISNYYQDLTFIFDIAEDAPKVTNIYYDEMIIEMAVGNRGCDEFEELKNVFNKKSLNMVNLILRFDTRDLKERFLAILRFFQAKKHLKDEQTLSILNQTNKPIEIYNQLRILVQENNFLHLNLKQKNQETNQIIQVSNKKISLDGTKKRSEIKALDERLKEMRYQESELNRAMEAKKEELKNMEEKYLDVYNDLKNQENFGNGLYNNTVNMRHTVSGHRHNKQQKEEKLDVLTEQNARLKFELKNLKAELERLNTNNKDVNLSTKIINENKMLKKELNALPECKREIERLNKELEKVDKINRGLGDYVSTLNVNELQSQNKSKDFEIKNLKEINDRMYKELLKYNKNIRKSSFL